MNRIYNIISLRFIFPVTLCVTVALAYCAVSPEIYHRLTIGIVCLESLMFWLLWRCVVKPRRMVQRGMELLSAQEANNRLAPVGQPDADRIAKLFNTLMARLHQERLRLQEQNLFQEKLIQASPMGVAMMDFDYRITHVNPAFMKLARIPDPAGILGLKLTEIPGPVVARIADMHDGEIRTMKYENRIILRCYMLSFMERGFKRPFILLESLTEEVMEAERRAYGKVIRIMAHEVNNSMTGISTLLDILTTYHSDDPEMSEFIASVNDRCQAMGRFIGAYADVVRLPDARKERLNLGKFLQSQLPFLRSNTLYPLEYEYSGEDLELDADPDMLSQLLVNIIKNSSEAITASGNEEGIITITAEYITRKGVQLTVTDNGCGISSETAAELFNPFFTTKPDGQGIGLTLIAEILRRHNASFSLRTDADGLTRFRIIFLK